MTLPACLTAIEDALARARSVLIAVGLDGTVSSMADKPDEGYTSGRTSLALERVATSPRVTLAVLSGRTLANIQTLVRADAIYAGNDGLEIGGGEFDFVHPEAERLTGRLRALCESIEAGIGRWPAVWVENKRYTAAVHVRNCPVDDWNAIRDAVRTVVRPVDDVFCLRGGRAAFEIVPRIGWDKGSAVRYIQRQLTMEDALTLCIGDDDPDEAMFRALPTSISIRVAPHGESDARYTLPHADAVTQLLEWIADALEESPRGSTLYRFSRGYIPTRTVGVET